MFWFICLWLGWKIYGELNMPWGVSVVHGYFEFQIFFCSCRTWAGIGVSRLATAVQSPLVGLSWRPFIIWLLAIMHDLACCMWSPTGNLKPPQGPAFAVHPFQGVKMFLFFLLMLVVAPIQRICPWWRFHLPASFAWLLGSYVYLGMLYTY